MIEELAYNLETDLILSIVKHLKTSAYGTADWKVKKLSQMTVVQNDINKIIRKYRVKLLSGVKTEMNLAAESLIAELRSALPPVLARDFVMSNQMRELVGAWTRTAQTQTNLAMAKLAESAGQSYVMAVSKASLAVASGADTHREALSRAIGELKSVTAFVSRTVDKNGREVIRQWTPEGYIPMVLRTNSARVVNELNISAADELGTDLVEVTAHVGARPLCYPYQGMILSLHGKTPGYKTLAETSYGEPAGLLGINCGHRLIPFVKGVSVKGESIKRDKEKNDEIYKESQEQRALERTIRNAKREEAKYRTAGETDKADAWAQRVKADQATMREFIDDTGRTRRYDREKMHRA